MYSNIHFSVRAILGGTIMLQKIYPRSKDKETVYLKSVITNPNIIVGDYTMYNES